MDKPKRRPPSLREFDYFSDDVDAKVTWSSSEVQNQDGPREADGLGTASTPTGTTLISPRQPIQVRQIVSLALTAAFLLFAVWFAWQFRAYAQYAFAPAKPPLLLGNVTEITPEMVPHNTYVSLHGITEHRGMHARSVRGLTLHHDDYWYFRLMGSRGVFIEVAPDVETFGPNTEVTVQGRALDPDLDPLYAAAT